MIRGCYGRVLQRSGTGIGSVNQTSVQIFVLSSVLKTFFKSAALATSPLATLVKTVSVCRTSSRFFSLGEKGSYKMIRSKIDKRWGHDILPKNYF